MNMIPPKQLALLAAATLTFGMQASTAVADLAEYYIGVDGLSGTPYGTDYEDNANEGRLTLLYAHGNHFHPIGAFSYTGPADSPKVRTTNSNNRLPEGYSGQEPLALTEGTGAYDGKLVSSALTGVTYSDLEMRNVQELDGNADDLEGLFDSSGGRWNGEFDGAHIHLELLYSSPGLHMSAGGGPTSIDDAHVFDGDEMGSFTPVFWTDDDAEPGNYTAKMRLVDKFGTVADSGEFYMDFQVVPEPGSLVLMGLGCAAALGGRRRRQR